MEHTCDWETSESPLLLQGNGFCDSGLGGNDNRVGDEAVLEALDLAHHLGLVVDGAVVVDDADSSQQSHVDGHVVLGDGVHRGRGEGRLEGDVARQPGAEIDVAGGEANVAGQHEEVVVCQTARLGLVHQIVYRNAIFASVGLEDFQCARCILEFVPDVTIGQTVSAGGHYGICYGGDAGLCDED